MKYILLPALIFAFGVSVFAQKKVAETDGKLPKLRAEEIVAKHLASIGTAEARAGIKSRVMVGVGVHTSKNLPGRIGGPAQFASEGGKFLLAMILNSNDYPYEKFGYDGREITTARFPGGGTSVIAEFLKSHKVIAKRGLFGGVLGGGWLLLATDSDIKLESAGTGRVGDKNYYKLRVLGSGTGDMSISLYFDPETFSHARTEYFYRTGQITSPNPNRPPLIGGTSPNTYTLTEDFSNFRKVDDLVLPLTYVVEYTTDAGKPLVWTINFSQVFNNQPLEPSVFKIA